jgi:hypothetical protein
MSELMDLRFLLGHARATITDPRAGAAEILRLMPPRPVLWMGFALMVVGSLFLGEIVTLIVGLPEDGPLTGQSPMALGLLQAAFLFLTVHAITYIGRLFGGTGGFDGALALMTWLQFIFLLVQVVQLVAMIVLPPLAGLITLVALGLFFWLLVNFIAELHGFTSVGQVFVMTLVSFVGLIFVLSLVLAILGITFETGGM